MLRSRAACPTFVGRADELALLREAFAAASVAVFVRGEACVGKSRLVGEYLSEVAAAATVLRGACQPDGGLTPYAPIVEALRGFVADSGRDLPTGCPLARLLAPHPAGPEQPGDDRPVGTDQRLLFSAVLRLLEDLADDRPVVLVIEDLHWSDTSTRELLDVLVRSLHRAPVLILGTYRDDEVPGRHPLRSLMAELARMPARVSHRELRRFHVAEARQQIEGILGDAAPDLLVHNVFDRSDGNPFLVEELVAATDRAELPSTLRDILLARCRELTEPALSVLRTLAVAGRPVDHELIGDAVGLPDTELLAALRTGVDRHVLVSTSDGYWFRHALVAEALLAEMLPGERIPMHRRIADALERARVRPAEAQRWAELAHHRLAARDLAPALIASVRAGLAAERSFAMSESLQHFERAIGL